MLKYDQTASKAARVAHTYRWIKRYPLIWWQKESKSCSSGCNFDQAPRPTASV